jgi:hypothetical protein
MIAFQSERNEHKRGFMNQHTPQEESSHGRAPNSSDPLQSGDGRMDEVRLPSRNSLPDTLFEPGHELELVKKATFSSVRESLSRYDISLMWNYGDKNSDDGRYAFRPSFEEQLGPGADFMMPISGAYLCSPGKNALLLPQGIDETLVKYMQDAGFLGEVRYLERTHTITPLVIEASQESGRQVYSIDDLGEAADPYTAHSQRAIEVVNSKEWVTRLSSYSAPEISKDVFTVNDQDFLELWEPGRRLFIKTCNTEANGAGVFPVSSLAEFRDVVQRVQASTVENNLNPLLVIQPEVVGENKSFQVLIDPEKPGEVQVITLTDQLMDDDGVTFMGNINHTVTADRLGGVGAVVKDFVEKVHEHCPDAVGIAMCDYFECEDGSYVVIDPGLRPTGNTGGAMVNLWFQEQTGSEAFIRNHIIINMEEPDLPYSEVVKRLGDYAQPDKIIQSHYGVLPWGYNHVQGSGVFILIAPTEEDFDGFREEVESLLKK